ncbi:hypothetical protein K440DRAFT_645429 [Wilcoxina mikolae CBS 423.85]|nr:hypothetical protein K440DRAFT_645429 [Wilcoxina mikolae CBS 423.85]
MVTGIEVAGLVLGAYSILDEVLRQTRNQSVTGTKELRSQLCYCNSRSRLHRDGSRWQGGLLAAVITASLSWPDVIASYWLVRAFWYSSLLMDINSVVVAFRLVAKLQWILTTHKTPTQLNRALIKQKGWLPGQPRLKIVILLQISVQLLNLSLLMYTVGLAVHVFSRLQDMRDEAKVAIFCGVVLLISVGMLLVGTLCTLETPGTIEEEETEEDQAGAIHSIPWRELSRKEIVDFCVIIESLK